MNQSQKYLSIALATLTALSFSVDAKVKLPGMISSGMIVQREQPVKLWGTADPGEPINVKVTNSKNKSTGPRKGVDTTADSDGKWSIEYPALKAGGPYTITINDEVVNDVLSGDVFLCSGQSNMELPVGRVTDMFADEIASYENPSIRQIIIPQVVEFHKPLDDINPSQWKPVNAENVMSFSALAYFFAKDLYERTGVPVGIINSSWGGTPVESWISEKNLAEFPRALNIKRIYEDDGYRDRIKRLEGENYARWNATMYANDPGLQESVKWYDPNYDDSSWATTDLITGTMTDGTVTGDDRHNAWKGNDQWSNDGLNPVNGSHWLRKNVTLPASMAGKPGVIRLGCIVDADSVYINGKFVGTTSYQYPPRIYNIPEGLLKEGVNNVTVRVISQNGNPHFVAEKPYKIIVGDQEVSLEGKWRYHLGTPMPAGPAMEFYCYKPTVLYNSMINPLINLPVAGAVWYQGESNVERRNEYRQLLKTMIADWREAFNDDDMPFYIVELADFLHPSDRRGRDAWAEMRKVQAQVADEVPGATLIKNSDLGEWNDIHPLDKKTLGKRVADAVINNINITK